ncbi:MAG: hypothetical protein J5I47_07905 [Vicingus serpentipes]|nr:hypothetical protein [Vicingus serpentipes]
MKAKDVLKKLNKDVAIEDQFKIASELPDDYFITEYISTGNPYMDYKINGGFPLGRFVLLAGGEGSAKTSIALKTGSNIQKRGKFLVYFDGEGTVDESYLTRFNIDKSLLIHHKGTNLEFMLDSAEELSKADDVGMIVIDSIPSFVSTVLEEKSASDNSMAVEARKYNARMPIIYGNCIRRDIILVGITFYKLDPKALGDPRKLPRGEWQKYMSSLTLEFSKKEKNIMYDNSGELVGVSLDVWVKKSKQHKADAKKPFKINFYYDFGYDVFDDYAELFEELGLISKSGSWYTLPDGEKVQGIPKVAEYLELNPEITEKLYEQSRHIASSKKNGESVIEDNGGIQGVEN